MKLLELLLPFEKDIYTVAVNSRVAAGGGGRFLWLKKEIESGKILVKEIKINTRKALKQYILSGKEVLVPDNIEAE